MKHKHRIKPGHEGGAYEEGNVVFLTPTQHAMWHFASWQRNEKWQDRIAWRALAGLAAKEEIVAVVLSEAGKKGGAWNKNPDNKHLKMHRKGKRHTSDARHKMRLAHEKRKDNPGDQLKKISPQQRKENGRKGNLKRWGWRELYPQGCEFRTSLSETFVDYAAKFGIPSRSVLA